MKHKMILLGAVAALSVGAASQSNARHNGWYVGLEAGANWVDDTDVFVSNTFFPTVVTFSSPSLNSNQLDFDTGWAGLGTVGYAFGNGWRIEGELGYRTNDFDTFFSGKNCEFDERCIPRTTRASGDLDEYTAMINVLYDIPITEKLDFTIGVGAGVDYAQLDIPGFADDSDTNFAFQAIAGVSYEITKRLDLMLTYRYLHVNEPEFADRAGRPVGLDDLEKHTLTVGLRYDLYEDEAPLPPAPPPPPPPPPGPQQFIIYFGFDKCNITPEADKVLSEAAEAARSGKTTRVGIVGHTDTMGSDAYNQKLSECRSGAAKSNLVNKGIDAGAISTSGAGESQLLVKTGDKVKEPQNRRATIDLN